MRHNLWEQTHNVGVCCASCASPSQFTVRCTDVSGVMQTLLLRRKSLELEGVFRAGKVYTAAFPGNPSRTAHSEGIRQECVTLDTHTLNLICGLIRTLTTMPPPTHNHTFPTSLSPCTPLPYPRISMQSQSRPTIHSI